MFQHNLNDALVIFFPPKDFVVSSPLLLVEFYLGGRGTLNAAKTNTNLYICETLRILMFEERQSVDDSCVHK